MAKRLAGKVALVSAASQGLGRAAAHALAASGAQVAICSRRPEAIRRAAAEIAAATGAEVIGVDGDLARAADPARIVEETTARFGGLDILFPKVQPGSTISVPVKPEGKEFDLDKFLTRSLAVISTLATVALTVHTLK